MTGRHKRGSACPARPSRTAAATRKLKTAPYPPHVRRGATRPDEKAPIAALFQSPLTDSNRRPLPSVPRVVCLLVRGCRRRGGARDLLAAEAAERSQRE